MGRVQGMLDEVFPSDATQLGMVKRQLDQLRKLVDDLHLLSMARAGRPAGAGVQRVFSGGPGGRAACVVPAAIG
ncbi:hypothetical protein [Pseudomonas sp. 770NI]